MEYTSLDEVWEDFEPIDENFNNEIINEEEKDNLIDNLEETMTENKNKSDEIEKLVNELEETKKINIELTDKLNKLEEIIKSKDSSIEKSNLENNCSKCRNKLKFLLDSKVKYINGDEKKEEIDNTLTGFINQNKDMIILILLIICIHFVLKTLRILKNIKNI